MELWCRVYYAILKIGAKYVRFKKNFETWLLIDCQQAFCQSEACFPLAYWTMTPCQVPRLKYVAKQQTAVAMGVSFKKSQTWITIISKPGCCCWLAGSRLPANHKPGLKISVNWYEFQHDQSLLPMTWKPFPNLAYDWLTASCEPVTSQVWKFLFNDKGFVTEYA